MEERHARSEKMDPISIKEDLSRCAEYQNPAQKHQKKSDKYVNKTEWKDIFRTSSWRMLHGRKHDRCGAMKLFESNRQGAADHEIEAA